MLTGLRVLITSGPTREHLDPIRFMTNASSGRMGYALAQEALARGARVTVVSGPVADPAPRGARVIPVTTALEMYRQTLKRCGQADVVVAAAAVSDWRFAAAGRHKLKRSPRPLRLTLIPNPDIIKAVARERARRRKPQVLVGFALETRRAVASARRKLEEKGLDLVVANGPASLGSAQSRAAIVSRKAPVADLGRKSKPALSRAIFDHVERFLAEPRAA